MKTISIKVDDTLDQWLETEAKKLGRTKSDIAREALTRRRNGNKTTTLHERAQHLCGIFKDGPRDLSTNPKYMKYRLVAVAKLFGHRCSPGQLTSRRGTRAYSDSVSILQSSSPN